MRNYKSIRGPAISALEAHHILVSGLPNAVMIEMFTKTEQGIKAKNVICELNLLDATWLMKRLHTVITEILDNEDNYVEDIPRRKTPLIEH